MSEKYPSPESLENRIKIRQQQGLFRELSNLNPKFDFSSNDYLGFAQRRDFEKEISSLLKSSSFKNGSGGSRLISGNYALYRECEAFLKKSYNAPAALIFNSGYSANLGLISSISKKGDIILYDQYIHASIREGIANSKAKSYKFKHNDLEDLKRIVNSYLFSDLQGDVYVIVESVYSMDGDSPAMEELANYCSEKGLHLIVDEAHGVGIFGEGKGLVCELGLEHLIFARIVTFGKAFGCHGAAVLGNSLLKAFLINFARSFIYTTALPPHTLANILVAHRYLHKSSQRKKLFDNISFFKKVYYQMGLKENFIESASPIQSFLHKSNIKVIAKHLQDNDFGVKAILSPTVPKGKERIRFCLHSYNESSEIRKLLELLAEIK